MRTCHLARFCQAPDSCSSPALPTPKQEGYQTDVFTHCPGHPEAETRVLAVRGKGKSDVPTLGRPSEDSVLNKYLSNESVHVCRELGTKMKVPWPLSTQSGKQAAIHGAAGAMGASRLPPAGSAFSGEATGLAGGTDGTWVEKVGTGRREVEEDHGPNHSSHLWLVYCRPHPVLCACC